MVMTDKRAQRRYSLVFPVRVGITVDGCDALIETECVELSASGLTLSCDEALIGALLAQARFPRTCALAFAPPESSLHFAIDCHVVRHRRLSRQHFHLVALFRHFREGSTELLTDYLASSAGKTTVWPRAAR